MTNSMCLLRLARLALAAVGASLSLAASALTFTVTNTNNAGGGTLRQAIIDANSIGGTNNIVFNIPGAGVHTITAEVFPPWPVIMSPTTINGYTQPGSSPNTNAINAGINAVLLIELTGSFSKLELSEFALGSVIRGLSIRGPGDGIDVGASNVTIAGNFLGSNASGTAGQPFAAGGFGVRHRSGNNLTIGGPAPADRNLLSGNGQGGVNIDVAASPPFTGHLIEGNYIGTDVTGTLSLQGAFGGPGLRNVNNAIVRGNLISGNPASGIVTGVVAGHPGSVTVQGNWIGTQRDGVSPLANTDYGIAMGTDDGLIGGPGALANVIAFNTATGVTIYSNRQGNRISGNSIHSNGLLGIQLFASGSSMPLANDLGDADTIPGNDGQNYPVITSASIAAGNATLSGMLNSLPSKQFSIEYFANVACGAQGYGQGRTFIGAGNVTTDGSGNASFGSLVFAVPGGQSVIASTATDVLLGNTSEFSQCVTATQAPVCDLDVNGDALVTADKDAVILLRYMLGIRGTALIAGVPLGPLRADVTAVETQIGTSAQYNVFGQPSTPAIAMQDGLVLLRLMQGVPDGALLNGMALPVGATFMTGSTVRSNVNARCGTLY